MLFEISGINLENAAKENHFDSYLQHFNKRQIDMHPIASHNILKEVNDVLKGLTTELVKLERRLIWQTCIIGSVAIITVGIIVAYTLIP